MLGPVVCFGMLGSLATARHFVKHPAKRLHGNPEGCGSKKWCARLSTRHPQTPAMTAKHVMDRKAVGATLEKSSLLSAFRESAVFRENMPISIKRVSDRDAWEFVGMPIVSSIHISPHWIKCRHPAARRSTERDKPAINFSFISAPQIEMWPIFMNPRHTSSTGTRLGHRCRGSPCCTLDTTNA